MYEEKRGFSWGHFIIGILFIIVALMAFRDPASDLAAIVIVFGISAIVKGIFEIFVRNRFKTLSGAKATSVLVLGVIDILIGIFLLINIKASILALPFIFAIWFLIDSIEGLFTLDLAKTISKGYYWFSLIVNILGIVVSIMLFANPVSSALTLAFLVGFYFMWMGILQIIAAF